MKKILNKELEVIEKATENDKRRILAKAVEATYSESNSDYCCGSNWAYMVDYDDVFVYWDTYKDGTYLIYKSPYTFNGTSAELTGDPVEVVFLTDPQDVEKSITESSILAKVGEMISKALGVAEGNPKPILKQLNDEQMIAIEPLYIAIDDVDGVGDTYMSPEVCHEMVKSFNKAIEDGNMSGNYFHKMMTDDFSPQKAWVNEVDCMVGDTLVKEGQPLVKMLFKSEKAWAARKNGDLMGVSIGAMASWEEV